MKNRVLSLKSKGFSLIELMVVIAIVGILSAVALPAYRNYIIKSRVASALPVLEAAKKKIISDNQTSGAYLNPTTLLGQSIALGGNVAVNAPPVSFIHYNAAGNNAYVCASMSDLGIDGMINPTAGNDGTKNRICMYVRYQNNIYTTDCGTWNGTDAADIPAEYLPGGCKCASVSTGAC